MKNIPFGILSFFQPEHTSVIQAQYVILQISLMALNAKLIFGRVEGKEGWRNYVFPCVSAPQLCKGGTGTAAAKGRLL